MVRLDGLLFLSRFAADGRAMGVGIPSASIHYPSYETADQAAQVCRAQGHDQCAVVDIYGNPIDVIAIKQQADLQRAKYESFWGK